MFINTQFRLILLIDIKMNIFVKFIRLITYQLIIYL